MEVSKSRKTFRSQVDLPNGSTVTIVVTTARRDGDVWELAEIAAMGATRTAAAVQRSADSAREVPF